MECAGSKRGKKRDMVRGAELSADCVIEGASAPYEDKLRLSVILGLSLSVLQKPKRKWDGNEVSRYRRVRADLG